MSVSSIIGSLAFLLIVFILGLTFSDRFNSFVLDNTLFGPKYETERKVDDVPLANCDDSTGNHLVYIEETNKFECGQVVE